MCVCVCAHTHDGAIKEKNLNMHANKKLINTKSNLAQSLKSNYITDYVQLKVSDMSAFSYTSESILFIPQIRDLTATEKDDFVNIQPKHNSATLWHYVGNTQWLSTQGLNLSRKLGFKKKNQ